VLQCLRTPDAFVDAELRPVLVSAVRRAGRQLRQERVGARLLDRDGLLAAVAHLARLSAPVTAANVYGTAAQKRIGRETWQAWWTEDSPQSCHRLVRPPAQPWQLDTLLRQLPATGSVLSLAVARERDDTDELAVEIAFRVAATDATALSHGDRALEAAVRAGGGRTERLDGEQVTGLAATLPLGGFLQ
jgi:type VII secretion protein EccE